MDGFQIPMRGNEEYDFEGDRVLAKFQIPMRGNEWLAVRPNLTTRYWFQIPMRGNEDDGVERAAGGEASFKSP